MSSVYRVWQALKYALAIRCIERGFILSEDVSHPESFGSRYAVFSQAPNAFRLIWDGKDSLFRLEYTQQQQKDDWPNDPWREIACISFPRDTHHDENSVVAAILPPAQEILATFREEPTYPIVDMERFCRGIRCLAVQLRHEGYSQDADRLVDLLSCAWTTGTELLGELAISLEQLRGQYSPESRRLLSECLHFARHHRRILHLD